MIKILDYLPVVAIVLTIAGCSAKSEPAPAAPVNEKAVQDFVNGKKLVVKSLGFYDNHTVNGFKEVKWIDAKTEKDQTTKDATEEEMGLVLQFKNDTVVIVTKKGKSFAGTYSAVNKTNDLNEGEQPGIKLNVTFADPDFGFGNSPMNVTYTYPVLGLDAKRIMLETPRSINRQKLISMMSE